MLYKSCLCLRLFIFLGKTFLNGITVGKLCYFSILSLGYHGNGYLKDPTISVF